MTAIVSKRDWTLDAIPEQEHDMTDTDKTTSAVEGLTRYITPTGCGVEVAPHGSGLLYLREEIDPLIADLERQLSETRDRALAEAAEKAYTMDHDLSPHSETTYASVVGDAIEALRTQPAPDPRYTNCIKCGHVVDTLPTEDGGDKFGDRLDGDQWVCSSECWEAASPLPAADPRYKNFVKFGLEADTASSLPPASDPVSDEDLRERVAKIIDPDAFHCGSGLPTNFTASYWHTRRFTALYHADAAIREMRADTVNDEPNPDFVRGWNAAMKQANPDLEVVDDPFCVAVPAAQSPAFEPAPDDPMVPHQTGGEDQSTIAPKWHRTVDEMLPPYATPKDAPDVQEAARGARRISGKLMQRLSITGFKPF